MAGLTIDKEDFLSCLQELVPLWSEQQKETGKLRALPIVVDWPVLVSHATQGRVPCFIVRFDDKIVGYSIFVITKSVQHATSFIAFNELLYIKPEFRDSRVVFHLLSMAEQDLQSNGVTAIRYFSVPYVKAAKGGVGKLYKFFGARPIETVYEKVLTPENAGRRRYGNWRNGKQRSGKSVHTASLH